VSAFSLKINTSALVADLRKTAAAAVAVSRPAAQAGAQVFHDAARANVRRSAKGHWFHGTSFRKTGQKYWFEAGTLQRAIYQAYSADNSNDNGLSTYHVSWNFKKAPYGHMVEFGTARAPAHPFLRPAFENNVQRAERAMLEEFDRRMKGLL
jgi:HK97 gp10 family phage protein